MTQEQLLTKWQRILRIQDWDITIRYAPWHEVHNEALAHVKHSAHRQAAEIVIRDPRDNSTEEWPGDHDVELTIVHELLHLKLAPLDIPASKRGVEEPLVETLAKCLLKLERNQKPDDFVGVN